MKVALVHDFLREYGGAERVLEILHSMYPEAPVYTSYYFAENMPTQFESWNIIPGKIQKWPLSRQFQKPYTYLVPLSFEQFDLRGYDLVISSSANFAKGVITHPDQIHVNYCHTPTRFLWGLNTQTKRNGMVRTLLGPLDSHLRQWDYAAAQRVDYFISNSETTKKRIKRFYNRDAEVIYPPVLAETRDVDVSDEKMLSIKKKYSLPDNYFLSVSRLFKVKNTDVIVNAFNTLKYPLVVVGTGSEYEYLKSIAQSNVVFTGFVSDEELRVLYSGARAFVAAATDEDFGMTVVEAQSYGIPIVAFRRGGYTETVSEGATGVFFDQLLVASLVDAIHSFELLHFEKDTIISSADRFSVSAFTSHFAEFIERVLILSR